MTLFDHVVHVRKPHSKLLRRALARARLAAAHEPYEDEVLHRVIVYKFRFRQARRCAIRGM